MRLRTRSLELKPRSTTLGHVADQECPKDSNAVRQLHWTPRKLRMRIRFNPEYAPVSAGRI